MQASLPFLSMRNHHDEMLLLEIEIDRLRLEAAREHAEEIVKELGFNENDEDYLFEVEMETRRQWDEECDRERERTMAWHHYDA